MNIDLLFPTLTGDLTQMAKANHADSSADGQEFEDMLVQQSKAQQENSRPQKKTEDKKAPEKPEQKSTQEDEATEKGGELAAALVTSQPVVPIAAFQEAQVTVAEDGTVILEPANMEGIGQEQAAETVGTMEVQPEIAPQQEQAAEGQLQQAAETVQEAPKQEQPKAEVQNVQEDMGVQETDKPEITVQKAQQGGRPQDEEMEENVEQQSQPVFRDVKAAPVKVADVQRPVDLEEPQAPQQIAQNVLSALEQGQSVVRLQLNPANLGSVTIELSRDAAGQLTIVMNPETVRAANILTEHSSSLMATLANNGEFTVMIAVTMPEDPENAGMMMNPDGHNNQNPEDEDDEKKKKRQPRTEGVNAADFLSQLRLGLTGRVD